MKYLIFLVVLKGKICLVGEIDKKWRCIAWGGRY